MTHSSMPGLKRGRPAWIRGSARPGHALLSAFGLLVALALGRAQPAADLSSDVYGDPFVRTWTAPVTPPEVVIGAGKKLAVRVRFIVDGTGRVTAARVLRSPDSALNEAALVAIRSWTFTPALDAGKPVPTCLDVPIVFFGSGVKRNSRDLNPPVLPEVVALTAAEPDFFPPGDYPTILTERKISGSVTFRCQVAANGRVSDPRITSATHVDFVLPGLAALTQWRFKPAHRGDLILIHINHLCDNRALTWSYSWVSQIFTFPGICRGF